MNPYDIPDRRPRDPDDVPKTSNEHDPLEIGDWLEWESDNWQRKGGHPLLGEYDDD